MRNLSIIGHFYLEKKKGMKVVLHLKVFQEIPMKYKHGELILGLKILQEKLCIVSSIMITTRKGEVTRQVLLF